MFDKKIAAKGIFWSAVERISSQGCQLILSIIIARLVMPDDYGKIAMVTVLLNIAQTLVDSGFANALIRKNNRTNSDFSTVFWSNIIISFGVYYILFLSSPFIASFYNVPELIIIIRTVSICLILNGLCIVQRTRLVIKLNFKIQAYISLCAVILSGILGIVLAYKEMGVWALIAQAISLSFLNFLLYWAVSKWRPAFVFSIESFINLFGFGSKLMIAGLINTIYVNMYTIAIGKFFSSKELGLYNRAEAFAKQPMYNVAIILARVIYPIECEWQNNNQELLNKYNQFLRLTSFFIFPLMFGFATLAKPIVRLILTEKWIDCVPILQFLCIVALFDPIFRLTWDIFNVKGRSNYSLWSEILNKSIALLILIITLRYGIMAVCYGMITYSILNLSIMAFLASKVLPGLSIYNIYKQIIAPLTMSLVMSCAIFYSISFFDNDILMIIFGVIIGILTYILLSILTHNKECQFILKTIKKTI